MLPLEPPFCIGYIRLFLKGPSFWDGRTECRRDTTPGGQTQITLLLDRSSETSGPALQPLIGPMADV